MEPGLGQRLGLGLASVPRLATPGWTVRTGGVGALGTSAAMGSPATTSAGLGARGANDVEPDRRRQLGNLEQRGLDSALTKIADRQETAGDGSPWPGRTPDQPALG
jgi:hypothetical protein